jgi:tetratricopeptide (TPR) repeat protein
VSRCEDYARATGIATSLIWYWITRATTEGARWLDEVLARTAGNPWTYFARGFLGVLQNDPDAATRALDRGVAVAVEGVLAQSLAMASIAATMRGDSASAQRHLDAALAIADQLDDPGATLMTYQATALNGLIDGHLDDAVRAAAEGARLSREAGDLYSLGMMLMNQGYAALRTGAPGAARERFVEGLQIARRIDDRVAQCYLVGGIGCCAAADRQPQLAARLLGASESLRAEIGAGVHPGMAPTLVEAVANLGRGAAFQAGRELNREAAVRLALGETPPAPHPARTL